MLRNNNSIYYTILFGLLFFVSCQETTLKTDSENSINKGEIHQGNESNKLNYKDSILTNFDETTLRSFITAELELDFDEPATFDFYTENILGSEEKEIIIVANLLRRAEKKLGKFDLSKDYTFGLTGKYQQIYVFNTENGTHEKLEINASAISPLTLKFTSISPFQKAIDIDYRIGEAGFKIVYAAIRNSLQPIFSTTRFNLKKYADDSLMVNHINYKNTDLVNGYHLIQLEEATILNYVKEDVMADVYSFEPKIVSTQNVKRYFYMDTLTWKYATN